MAQSAQSILEQLVSISSVNPDHHGNPEHQGEARIANFLEKHLLSRGFRVDRLEVLPNRPNLIARAGAASPQASLCLEAHMDTVSVTGMSTEPFTPWVKDGRLYGRGACDTKGPMAAALACLTPERLAAAEAAGCELVFLGAIGEETGLLGARQLVESGFRTDAVVVLEPTGLQPVIAHKGACWMSYRLKGIAGHASSPAGTVNAIRGAAEFIVRAHADHEASLVHHPLLGESTLNIGIIQAGSAPNIVPDVCRVDLDRRYLPGESVADLLHRWTVLLDALTDEGMLAGYEVQELGITDPLIPLESSFIQQEVQRILKRRGRASASVGSAWCSDAVPLSKACSDFMVFGPGDIAQAHTHDEYIELSELEQGTEIMGELLDAWIAGRGKKVI
jgi:acetylornithine deacetylase